jgi:hypothetical protein
MAVAAYPVSIKSFLTYHDQPSNPSLIVPDPDKPGSTVDLTIDRAKITDEIHDEVVAMESTIGIGIPLATPGAVTIGSEITYLFQNLSPGQADPITHVVYPLPPPSHNHIHDQLGGNDADVHPQYMRVDGTRSFGAAVSGQPATAMNDLATLGQAQGQGWLNYTQAETVINNQVLTEAPYPMISTHDFPGYQRYHMTGGLLAGYTDSNGLIRIDYSRANFRGIASIVFMKLPYPGSSAYGYTYRYEEDQLILWEIDNSGAWIRFSEDIVVDRQAWVALTWMVLGV